MDVWCRPPGFGQGAGDRHTAVREKIQPHAPVTKVRQGYDGALTDTEHLAENSAGIAHRLERL